MRPQLTGKSIQLAGEARRPFGSRYFNDRGDLNASDNRDAFRQMAQFFEQMSKGSIVANDEHLTKSDKAKERRELLTAAVMDPEMTKMRELGAAISNELTLTADREGFMRRLLTRIEVPAQGVARVPIRRRDGVAFQSTGPSAAKQSFNRENYITLDEWYCRARIFVEEREILQTVGDLLEKKYLEAQEAIMAVEDRQWKYLADLTVGVDNQLLYMSGGFNPTFLTTLISNITRFGFTPNVLLLNATVVADIQAQANFTDFFDPVTKLELIQTGQMGTLLGLTLITDSYRDPILQVLNPGEVYAIATGDVHGGYTDRGPVQATPFNGQEQDNGIPGRGWNMWELLSMVVSNTQSVSKGLKV